MTPDEMDWRVWLLLSLGYGLAACQFAVRCHRVLLLGSAASLAGAHRSWTMRETRFFIAGLTLYIIYLITVVALVTVVGSVVANITGNGPRSHGSDRADSVLGSSGGDLFLRPLSLALPAAALDHDLGLHGAWALSRGNGWRLMLLVGLLPMAFSGLLELVDREGASAVENALMLIAGIPLMVIEIAALSLSYRELRDS